MIENIFSIPVYKTTVNNFNLIQEEVEDGVDIIPSNCLKESVILRPNTKGYPSERHDNMSSKFGVTLRN